MSRRFMPCYNVNPLKCKWAVEETGYWLTPIGLNKPWHKKIDAICGSMFLAMPRKFALLSVPSQFNDISLQAARNANPTKCPILDFGVVPLICYYLSKPNATWKIAIPTPLLKDIVRWYHCVLNHTGMTRLLHGPGYGTLPPREAPLVPWEEVAVNLIGPWKIKVNRQELVFHALTCIDPVINLTKLICINNKHEVRKRVDRSISLVFAMRSPSRHGVHRL